MAVTTPCREWHASNYPAGYGRRWDRSRRRMVAVHRWVMAQVHGWEAIEGRVVMHLCDNPPCYRFDHLRIGTLSDNTQDMLAKGRARGGFAPGHVLSPTKLTPAQVTAIRSLYAAGGIRQVDLAERFGVSQRMVSRIVRQESWRGVA